MLDLHAAIKKISRAELKERWEELKNLPSDDQRALMTYAVISVLLVCTLVAMLATYHS